MKRLLLVPVVTAFALAALASPAGAANECAGLQICVPVSGPWVALPGRSHVEFQLACPRGYVVGGLDAELSIRAIDVFFLGRNGSPVSPGRTTTGEAVFEATYLGVGAPAPSFRPHIGCVPASGGGGRIPTAVGAFPPGQAGVRRVRTVRLSVGATRVRLGCAAGERLVAGSHAVGFYTASPPAARLVRSVAAAQSLRDGRVVVSVRTGAAVRGTLAIVQVSAICAAGR